MMNLAIVYEKMNDREAAESYYGHSYELSRAVDDKESMARFHVNQGMRHLESFDFAMAEKVNTTRCA